MAALLRSTAGWVVNDKRVERIWRQEGLKVPPRQPKRSRIWPGDGACVRLRAERPNHGWSYGFVEDRTHDGRKYRMLNVVDEFTRECLSIRINRKLKSTDVIDVLSGLFILRGVPEHIRSDNGPEFIAKAVQDWITAVGAKTAYIEPGSPWENGYLDVRFIATSKADPEAEMAAGRLRADLYYRLNAAMLRVPPLRARREDVPQLFLQLVRESAARHRMDEKKAPPDLLARLSGQEWPGNVRELRNAAERFVLGLEHGADTEAARDGTRLARKVADYERSLIAATIAAHGGRLRAVYETLGISRKTLYEKMQKHGLDRRLILEGDSEGE